jgi:hypothetical protein
MTRRLQVRLARQHAHLLVETADRVVQLDELESRITKERVRVVGRVVGDCLD